MVFQAGTHYSYFSQRWSIWSATHLVAPNAKEILEDHFNRSDFADLMDRSYRNDKIPKSVRGELSRTTTDTLGIQD